METEYGESRREKRKMRVVIVMKKRKLSNNAAERLVSQWKKAGVWMFVGLNSSIDSITERVTPIITPIPERRWRKMDEKNGVGVLCASGASERGAFSVAV